MSRKSILSGRSEGQRPDDEESGRRSQLCIQAGCRRGVYSDPLAVVEEPERRGRRHSGAAGQRSHVESGVGAADGHGSSPEPVCAETCHIASARASILRTRSARAIYWRWDGPLPH